MAAAVALADRAMEILSMHYLAVVVLAAAVFQVKAFKSFTYLLMFGNRFIEENNSSCNLNVKDLFVLDRKFKKIELSIFDFQFFFFCVIIV